MVEVTIKIDHALHREASVTGAECRTEIERVESMPAVFNAGKVNLNVCMKRSSCRTSVRIIFILLEFCISSESKGIKHTQHRSTDVVGL